jgi:hypothetical protein
MIDFAGQIVSIQQINEEEQKQPPEASNPRNQQQSRSIFIHNDKVPNHHKDHGDGSITTSISMTESSCTSSNFSHFVDTSLSDEAPSDQDPGKASSSTSTIDVVDDGAFDSDNMDHCVKNRLNGVDQNDTGYTSNGSHIQSRYNKSSSLSCCSSSSSVSSSTSKTISTRRRHRGAAVSRQRQMQQHLSTTTETENDDPTFVSGVANTSTNATTTSTRLSGGGGGGGGCGKGSWIDSMTETCKRNTKVLMNDNGVNWTPTKGWTTVSASSTSHAQEDVDSSWAAF